MIDYTGKDLDAIAKTVYAEASGEGEDGMRAVAHVIKNRVLDPRWPGTVTGVCFQPWQFSVWNPDTVGTVPDANYYRIKRLNRNDPLYVQCLDICKKVLNGGDNDLTQGADHYHTAAITNQVPWRDDLLTQGYKTKRIGQHIFYY